MELTGSLLAQLERLCAELAREAGTLIVRERPQELAVAATKTSTTDVVTVMDQRSERLLRERIATARPQDGVLGEEGEELLGTSGVTWVIDPIDGTVNYLYDLPQYAVSVAACVGEGTSQGGWQPVAGAVYNPVLQEMYLARQGGGARRQMRGGAAEPIAVSRAQSLEQSLVGTGFGYESQVRGVQGECVAALLPHVRDIRRSGSAALDLCAVASGRLDVYYESGLNAWDLAAGQVIVTEAGGVVRGSKAGAPNKDLTLAGPRMLVDQLTPWVDPSSASAAG